MKTKVEVDQPSLQRHIRALKAMRDKDLKALADGIPLCLNAVLKKSNYYCPVETGELKASGRVRVEGTGRWTTGVVEYTARHAVPVHERVQARHAPPTCAKFLERGARESKGVMTRIMGRQIEVT